MPDLLEFRAGKPAHYPDQAVYAAYASATFGLSFDDIDDGSGVVFRIASKTRTAYFGAGRCSWYPQNSATAATLASDKYFANRILEDAGLATLGGEYFFLNARHRAHRPKGHERDDAVAYLRQLGSSAFVKPLAGSRGDYAQVIHGEAGLDRYLDEVSRYYDAVLMQPIVGGNEYRLFVLDDELVYAVRKFAPVLVGDGRKTTRELLAAHNTALGQSGLSTIEPAAVPQVSLDAVPRAGERLELSGRANLSAGGSMTFEPPSAPALLAAREAMRALGLRAGAVDLFTEIGGNADDIRIIEVNSNPSIRHLEDTGRTDLILKIWQHTFAALGLIHV